MNRKQRRSKSSQKNQTRNPELDSANDIPLSRPNTNASKTLGSKTKTLFEIAAERQAQLQPNTKPFSTNPNVTGIEHVTINPNTSPSNDDGIEETPPWLDTLLLSTSLSAIHFTLEVLTVHQYAQELKFGPIISHTLLRAWPTWIVLVGLFHGHLVSGVFGSALEQRTGSGKIRDWVVLIRQVVYLAIANGAGCYLIGLTNDRGYYAVMKNAPSIGTLWVWAIIEMGLGGALLGVLGPGFYAWWTGYSIF